MAAIVIGYFLQVIDFRRDKPVWEHVLVTSGWVCLFAFTNIVIIYAVCRMRNTINTVKRGSANESLMLVHCINFTAYSVFEITESIIYLYYTYLCSKNDKNETD